MNNQIDRTSVNEYKRNWGIVSAFGLLSMWLSSMGPHECSPVIGCGPEILFGLIIVGSLIVIVIRLFKRSLFELITPVMLLAFSYLSLYIFVSNTVWSNTLSINGNHNDSFCVVSICSRINYSYSNEFLCSNTYALDFYYGWNFCRWEWTAPLLWDF